MAEAIYLDSDCTIELTTPTAGYSPGQVICCPDGRAGVIQGLVARVSGEKAAAAVEGRFKITKAASVVVIAGAPLWWDHSANSATPVPPTGAAAGDKDFYLGTAVADETSSSTEVTVDLNVKPEYIVDMQRDGGDTAVVLTAGTPYIYSRGGSLEAGFSATAEAQKLDWLSKRSFPVGSKWVLEAIVEVVTNADADVADMSIGVANATHASDADSITESAFFHFDLGADLNIDAESDDGTTEVNATDTTIDFALGTPLHLVLDGRDSSNVKYYINGVEVLAATANLGNIAAATGPLKALFHLEKSSNDSPGVVQLDALRVRFAPDN